MITVVQRNSLVGGMVLLLCALATADEIKLSPADLVRDTVRNETRLSNDSPRHMFLSNRQTASGLLTKLYCETKEAMAGMAIAYDNKPLTPQQRAAEDSRLDDLIRNPSELAKKRQREKEDADRTMRIVRAMPDAFLYEYDGTEPAKAGLGKAGDPLVRLKFRPNPRYDPPSRVEQVLQGMQGVLLIDAHKRRIARIDGTLFKEVSFGWGILGHLDKGGHFLVEQADVGDGTWDIVRMSLGFTGKILIFKRLDIRSDEVFSDFHEVPKDLTFAQGVELLRKQEAMLAENRRNSNSDHQ
ncbi:MAG TPA: hypothetical protein VK466_08545 [Terriglobales bacterium]|nr:hypothetical protein [Terriglobales bacterium]